MLIGRLRFFVALTAALVLVMSLGLTLVANAKPPTAPAKGGGGQTSQALGGPNFQPQDALNTLYRWALGYDERDSDLMRDTFTEDARFVFFLAEGGEPIVFEGIEAVMGLFEGSLAAQNDKRRHVTTNPIVERIDRTTVRITSVLTLLVIADPTQPPVLQSTGVYVDTLVYERDGVWRIRERQLTLDTPA
jgi:hypothetical protein